jgi:serine/threonine protein kinase/TPR repeat protein
VSIRGLLSNGWWPLCDSIAFPAVKVHFVDALIMPEVDRYKQYEVLRREDGSLWELGRGAMGITYKAYDTNLHCAVALKIINSTYLGNDTARQRFLREARAAAALRHPNVASVFNLSTDQDSFFYVMEFIDGETVDAYVKRKGRLEPIEALNIGLQVARALAAADRQRLVHRDLKPSNLMLIDQEGESVVKVIDFGLAKSAKGGAEDTGTLTVEGFVGTPHYASPEQVEEAELDVRSDIYSLGATLYYMIAGKPPFSGSVGQIMSQHLYKPIAVEPLTNVPLCVVSLLQRMLEKDRDKRPQTPRELQNAIVECLGEIQGGKTSTLIPAGDRVETQPATAVPLAETATPIGTTTPTEVRTTAPEAPAAVQPGRPSPAKGRWLLLAIVLIALAGVGVYFYLQQNRSQKVAIQQTVVQPSATPIPTPTPIQEIATLSIQTEPANAAVLLDNKPPDSPPNTFSHVPFGKHQLMATLDNYEPLEQEIEVGSGTSPEIRLTLKQKPNRRELLMSEVKKYDEGTPEFLSAYVRLVQFLKNSGATDAEEETAKLSQIIDQFRSRTPPVTKDEFGLFYRQIVSDAADLKILSAILWLADNAKGTDAFNLFQRAADLGDSYAMMKLGRAYLRKASTNDEAEGFRWLNQAFNAPHPNLEAGAYIGDCYLSGKGTKQDPAKAEQIIMPLANQKVVPAMTLAGRILQYKADLQRIEAEKASNPQQKKLLNAQANDWDRQAREWWEQAAAKEDWNAVARLGQCYQEGWGGLPKNEAEAEKRYQEGADHGNVLSMFFFGLLIDKKPGRRSEAEGLISKAASAGLPSAEKWCSENNVTFSEVRADEQ